MLMMVMYWRRIVVSKGKRRDSYAHDYDALSNRNALDCIIM